MFACKTYHSVYKASLLSTVATILAPWFGGFDQAYRTCNSICEKTFALFTASFATMQRLPTLSSVNKNTGVGCLKLTILLVENLLQFQIIM